jgi:hypothetical protein
MKNEELDKFVYHNLEKLELEIPAEVQNILQRRIATIADQPRPKVWKRIAFWASLSAATLLLAVASLPLLFPPRIPEKKISQIRTEFSIPEKNIKIIWVQRDDFHLRETKG